MELALELSYRRLRSDRRRLLKLAALHPGQNLDPYAAAALADADLPTTETLLCDLSRDHLLQHGVEPVLAATATRLGTEPVGDGELHLVRLEVRFSSSAMLGRPAMLTPVAPGRPSP